MKNVFIKIYKRICNVSKDSQSGITLIELLLYMGIFSILLMVLVGLFGAIVNINLESQATSSVSTDGRYILNQMAYTIRQAQTFTTPSAYGSSNSTSTLVFTTTGGTTYTYNLSSGKLMISDGVHSDQLNSVNTTVSNLSFTRLESTSTTTDYSITVSFTLTSTTREQKGYEQKSFQTTISER